MDGEIGPRFALDFDRRCIIPGFTLDWKIGEGLVEGWH